MATVNFLEERVLFSPTVPDAVNQLLQAAVAASHADPVRAEKLFLQAQALDKHCLQAYFALYKFYFYQKRLAEAESVVLAGLAEAAQQGGFPCDYRQLAESPDMWDLYASETTLFYLYTLKALAFIRLRQGYDLDAQRVLANLKQLDPKDLSGASVIMDLAAGVAA
ncbi:hypothetical protein [Methylovulum miyakonense]|uniref:hypothetical protein n=1 Tax=Methylovulum miyakonense TaxID=645578 RepID=UPI0003690DDA|nr:hypothetical protein [Methylovulum miyakonense]